MSEKFYLPESLRAIASSHFALLDSQNPKKKRDTIQLNLSGYSDVMYLIADITKVCMLALEYESGLPRIPEPATNICGVLGIILDLIPYEEADLLDKIREQVLMPCEEFIFKMDFIEDNLYLTTPPQLKLSHPS
jgi:hypothetical protein